MVSLHLTNSILSLSLSGILPGLSITINVERLPEPAPLKIDIKVKSEVTKP